jgi:hypothetical protein
MTICSRLRKTQKAHTTAFDFGSAAENYQRERRRSDALYAEGYVRVRSIAISPAGEISSDYTALKDELTTLESQ